MKNLEKVGIAVLILLITAIISIPLINDYYAYRVKAELCKIPLPDRTELLDSVYKAGKLTGNGNGMQYFGAILIKSELSLNELEDFYSDYREQEWTCVVEQQEGRTVKGIEHGTVRFSEEAGVDGFYIVYSWGEGPKLLEEMDIRGH